MAAKEEKRSEALFCAWLTAYSMVFSVTTASQLLVQMSSLWLSIYMFALYVVQLEYKDIELQLCTGVPELNVPDLPSAYRV